MRRANRPFQRQCGLVTDGSGRGAARARGAGTAWLKRKMLSMKRGASWFFSSRKYSAVASAEERRAGGAPEVQIHLAGPGRLWRGVFWLVLASLIFVVKVVAFTGALTDARECKPPWPLAMLLLSSMMTTVLADARAARERRLYRSTGEGQISQATLMPVSRDVRLDYHGRLTQAFTVEWVAFFVFVGPRSSRRRQLTLNTRPSTPSPGTVMRLPAIDDRQAALEPSVEHGSRAHPAAKVLLDFRVTFCLASPTWNSTSSAV